MRSLPDKETLRLRIKTLMAEKGLSQVEVARQANVNPSTLSHFLLNRGRGRYPHLSNICKLTLWAGLDDETLTAKGDDTFEKIRYVIRHDKRLHWKAQDALIDLMKAALEMSGAPDKGINQ